MLEKFSAGASSRLVVNADDANLVALAERLAPGTEAVESFAMAPELLAASPWLARGDNPALAGAASAPTVAGRAPSVTVEQFGGHSAVLDVAGERVAVVLPARGLHYAVDAAAAFAMARALHRRTVRGADRRGRARDDGCRLRSRGDPAVGRRGHRDPHDEEPAEPAAQPRRPRRDPGAALRRRRRGHARPVLDLRAPTSRSSTTSTCSPAPSAGSSPPASPTPTSRSARSSRSSAPALDLFLALPPPERGRKVMLVNYEQMMLIRKRLGYLELEGAA